MAVEKGAASPATTLMSAPGASGIAPARLADIAIEVERLEHPLSTQEFLRLRVVEPELARQFKATAAQGRHIQSMRDGSAGAVLRYGATDDRDEAFRKLSVAWADSAEGLSGTAVFNASQQFHLTRVAAVKACNAFDYVISPVAPNVAFQAELPSPTNDPLRPLEHIGFTVPFNMSEQPAASINCGYTAAGLPIGLQIAGKRFDDLGVLQVARAFEIIREGQRPWPLPPSEAIHHVD